MKSFFASSGLAVVVLLSVAAIAQTPPATALGTPPFGSPRAPRIPSKKGDPLSTPTSQPSSAEQIMAGVAPTLPSPTFLPSRTVTPCHPLPKPPPAYGAIRGMLLGFSRGVCRKPRRTFQDRSSLRLLSLRPAFHPDGDRSQAHGRHGRGIPSSLRSLGQRKARLEPHVWIPNDPDQDPEARVPHSQTGLGSGSV